MRSIYFCILLLVGFIAGDTYGADIKQVTLNDRSIIHGEILSLSDGLYTLKSISLGTIKIEESKIQSITPLENIKKEIQTFEQKIMNNAELLNIILPLQDDPDFQKALEDPSIIEAIEIGDMNALLSNPKFIKLLDNVTILNIKDQITK